MNPISDQSVITRRTSPLSADVGHDVLLFNEKKGRYFGVSGVGAEIWRLLERELSVEAICDKLVEEYVVDRETCRRDVLAFLHSLQNEELIEVRN